MPLSHNPGCNCFECYTDMLARDAVIRKADRARRAAAPAYIRWGLNLWPQSQQAIVRDLDASIMCAPDVVAHLPLDAAERKRIPIATGVIDYFPDAIVALAELSRAGNDQHNPGKPLHWDRSKSGDESDTLMRHFIDRGTLDSDGIRHSTKVAWRGLALLQKEIEKERAESLAFRRGIK